MKTKQFLCMALLLLNAWLPVKANPIEEGKTLFMTRCAACHNVNKVLTGPALAGVDQRRSMDWIIKFVHSSQALVKGGDKEAIAVFEKFNKVPMPDHADLTEANIINIVEYIKTSTKPIDEKKGAFAKPRDLKPLYTPLSLQQDYLFFLAYLGAVTLLGVALWLAVRIRSFRTSSPHEEDAA